MWDYPGFRAQLVGNSRRMDGIIRTHLETAIRLIKQFYLTHLARVAELVDAADLKSADHCDRAGSIPAPGTNSCANVHDI